MKNLELGIYQHYKGNRYLVLGLAKHSETGEDLVIYVSLYPNDVAQMWARPLTMFTGNVVVDGETVQRFKKQKN